MPDTVPTILLIAAVLLFADVLLAGGATTMTAMPAMTGAVAHPLAAGARVLLTLVLVPTFGWAR